MSTQIIASTPAPVAPVEAKPAPGIPGQSATAKAAESKEAPAVPTQAPEMFEVKVNGQMRKYTRDQLIAKASLAEAATERFEEASKKEKAHAKWKESAQKDFLSALQDPELGLSREQIRDRFEQWYKQEFIDPEMMNPDQREAAKWKREAEEAKAWREEQEANQRTQAEQAEASQMRETVQQEIIGLIEKSGLPKTRFTASRVAYWMQQNIKRGFNVPQETIIQQVREELNSVTTSAANELTGEALVQFLGEDIVKKIRAYDMERLKSKYQTNTQPQSVQTNDNGTTTRASSSKAKSMKDVDSYLNDLRRSPVQRRS